MRFSVVWAWCRSPQACGATSKPRAVPLAEWAALCLHQTDGWGMAEQPRKQFEEIEQTQEALRESIEQAKELADKTQELLQNHKRTIEDTPPD